MEKIKKRIKLFPLLICVASLLMAIGYSAINSVTFDISGSLTANAQEGIVILDVAYVDNNEADLENTKIKNVYGTTIISTITLSKSDGSSWVKYEISFYNNAKNSYIYDGVSYIVGDTTYDNESIIFTVEGINEGEVLLGYSSVNITITFSYLDNKLASSNILNSYLNFLFINGTDNIDIPSTTSNSLTPVKYDGSSWVIVDENDGWYDYNKGEWANAVVLESDSAKIEGDTIIVDGEDSDIIAMFVWIPRYEYKIIGQNGTHLDGSEGTSTNPGKIEINFISKEKETPTDGYTIHPAFTFDGEAIEGIWVGKFETSAKQTSSCYTSESLTNCNNSNVSAYILPNAKSLRYQSVYNQYATSLNFSSNLVDSSGYDSHMMKNSEWGAVAYLAQSIYGKYGNSDYTGELKEVYVNNSANLYTGRSGGAPTASSSSEGSYEYDELLGMGASTTGNIYGVYDMNGGTYEYVMGYLTSASSTWGASSEYNHAGFSSEPNSKYFDGYTGTTSGNECSGVCYGHALSETNGWYNDTASPLSTYNPWYLRGGVFDTGSTGGIFSSLGTNGYAGSYATFRIVLVELYN